MTLTVKDAPFFVKGTQSQVLDWCVDPNPDKRWSRVVIRQGVSATSTYAITSWDVSRYWAETGPDPWVHYAQAAPPVVQWSADNYDATCGGGSGQRGTIYRVTDARGNVATLEGHYLLDVVRWDKSNVNQIDDSRRNLGSWTFSGTWRRGSCNGCDGAGVRYTSRKGAAATFRLPAKWADRWGANPAQQAAHLGFIGTKGPGRGKATLYLDGAKVATIDTYAAVLTNAATMWDFGP